MGLHFFALVLLLLVSSSESTAVPVNQTRSALQAAMADMQLESYFGFVILLKMLGETMNTTEFDHDITFLMPDDRALSDLSLAPKHLLNFLRSHSIPKSLSFEDIAHMPDGTLIPTSIPDHTLRVSTDKRLHVFINDARIVAPNLCLSSSIKCHGIHGVVLSNRRHPKDTLPEVHESTPDSPTTTAPAPVKRTRQNTAPAPVKRTRPTLSTAPTPVKRTHQNTAPAPVKRTRPILSKAPAPVKGTHKNTVPPVKRTRPILSSAPAPVKRTHQNTAPAPVKRTRPILSTAPAPVKRTHQNTAPAPIESTHQITPSAPAPIERTHRITPSAQAPIERTNRITPPVKRGTPPTPRI